MVPASDVAVLTALGVPAQAAPDLVVAAVAAASALAVVLTAFHRRDAD